MGLKYSYHCQYIFFPSGYWHHKNGEDPKVETMDECQHRKYWPKWKECILTKLDSLENWEVFGPIVQMPKVVKLVGYKWVFIRKMKSRDIKCDS